MFGVGLQSLGDVDQIMHVRSRTHELKHSIADQMLAELSYDVLEPKRLHECELMLATNSP